MLSCSATLPIVMNVGTWLSIIFSGLVLLPAPLAVAQQPGRADLKLDLSDKTLSVSQYQVKTEPMERGGIRITYTNPNHTQGSWINITKKLDKAVVITRTGFELKVAGAEDPIAGIVLENGTIFTKKMAGQGDVLSEYEAEFAGLEAKGERTPDSPAKEVTLTFHVANDDDGEKTIELKKWWIE